MISDQTFPEFKRHAVQPVECLKRGWDLIRDQYWLFVGMSLVGLLIGNAALGLMTGPMMCGLYIALLMRQGGEKVEFVTLFKGFDFFVDGLIAGILHAVPVIVIIAPIYIVYIVMMFTQMGARRGVDPDPAAMMGFLGVIGICMLFAMILLIILAIGFAFTYPLIVDRKLSGVNAVRLSFKAGMANFWSLLGLLLLNGLLGMAGGLLCGVGAYFVLPITYAALAVAYTQVFGAAPRPSLYTPPPPPSF